MEDIHNPDSFEDNFNQEQEQLIEEVTTPPNTILVQWNNELLLLDAWNEEGVSSEEAKAYVAAHY